MTSLKGITLILFSFSFSRMNFASLFLQSKSSRESAIGTHEESSKGASLPSTVKYPLTEMFPCCRIERRRRLVEEDNKQKLRYRKSMQFSRDGTCVIPMLSSSLSKQYNVAIRFT